MLLDYQRELAMYDTLDKLKTLAKAIEADISAPLHIYALMHEYKHKWDQPTYTWSISEGKLVEDGYPPITEESLLMLTIDHCQSIIYDEILVRREKRKLEKLIFGDSGNKSYFVTIGLDDKQFKDDNEALIINPLVKKLIETSGFDNVKFVVEKFRKNEAGQIYIHRHIHLLFDSSLRKSKVIQFCFQKAKKYVAGQNFIDVKLDPGRSRDKYISGEKTDSKMECVKMDRSWRQEKKIIEYS